MVEPIRPIGQRTPQVAPVELRPLTPVEREQRKRAREEARKRRRAARLAPPPERPGGLDVHG